MKLYACDKCKYLFESEEKVEQCPDCGKFEVRPATQSEIDEFIARQMEDDKWYVGGAWNERKSI